MESFLYAYQKISAVIERFERDQSLCMTENFIERMNAIDVLEFQMVDAIEQVEDSQITAAERSSLIQRTEALRQKLDDTNAKLFTYLIERIRSNDRATVRQYFRKAEQQISQRTHDEDVGYDEIDMLVNGLVEVAFVPSEPEAREADMMFYQPTPARIILKLIDKLNAAPDDVFYDLGSGLGHVPIVVNLLTDIKTKGIELAESYVRYSEECRTKLGLTNVEFIQADARHVDYHDGTIFYLYTPFQGETLRQVLTLLEAESKQRPIRVCTYGPCTAQVGRQKWLQPIYQTGKREDSFSIFNSL